MHTDRAKRLSTMNAILATASYVVSALGAVVGMVWGPNSILGGAIVLYVFGCVCANRSRHYDNILSIIDLQNRISALEAGSPNDSKSES